jgi:hypothetical protein
MSTRFDMADSLVHRARERYAEFEGHQREAQRLGKVTPDLQLTAKEVIDHLRSALDYCAKEMHERCGGAAGAKVYFPIAPRGFSPSKFRSLVGSKIPGLRESRGDLVPVLESFQAFFAVENDWLPVLATLSNENKHERLSAQQQESTYIVVAVKMTDPLPPEEAKAQLRAYASALAGTGHRVAPTEPNNFEKVVQNLLAKTFADDLGVSRLGGFCDEREPDMAIHLTEFHFSAVGQAVGPFLSRAIAEVAQIIHRLRHTV